MSAILDDVPFVVLAPRRRASVFGRIWCEQGDCLAVMDAMIAAGVTVDSIVTDPPYHLTSMVKRFGAANAAPAQFGSDGRFARASAGFMGQTWDGGDVAFRPETWKRAFAMLKPGGHLLAFGGTRTYHRLASAIEDAGFEIRDCIQWLYGSGFPKSHDVSKGIDRTAGAERDVIGTNPNARSTVTGYKSDGRQTINPLSDDRVTAPATDAARAWDGWGTALKPACEMIVLARKPLIGTVAENVLEFGTGALNIDGCRVSGGIPTSFPKRRTPNADYVLAAGFHKTAEETAEASPLGRWPANVILDGDEEVLEAFAQFGERASGARKAGEHQPLGFYANAIADRPAGMEREMPALVANSGTAARFFYHAKASKADRAGSKHPTVKPIALLRYLARLVTPPGGTVLDPFAGSGTLGAAAHAEGFGAILIEREDAWFRDLVARISSLRGAP